jgi:hypothetical protein
MSSSGGGNTNWFTSPTSQVTVTSGPALITSTLSATAAPSVYTFYAASNSCVSNPRTPVTVTVNPRPAINLAISDTVICAGNAVSLYAAGATNYTWSSGTQVIALSSSAVVTPAVSALYQVSGSNIYGCTNINSIHVTVHPLPVLVAGANPTLLCAGTASSATLYAFGAASYTWSDGQQVIAQVPAAVAFPTVTTIYQLTGSTANGCSSNSLVQVTVQRCDDVGFHKEITAVQLVNIYPNPSDGTLKITAGQNTVFDRIELSDLQGRTISVYALPVAGNTYELKNSTLTPGVYFCEIKSGSKTLSLKKIIITD